MCQKKHRKVVEKRKNKALNRKRKSTSDSTENNIVKITPNDAFEMFETHLKTVFHVKAAASTL